MTDEEKRCIPNGPPVKATTLRQRLGYIKSFFDFLRSEYLYAGLTHNDMDCAQIKIDKMQKMCSVSKK